MTTFLDGDSVGPGDLDDHTVDALLIGEIDASAAPAGYDTVALLVHALQVPPTADECAVDHDIIHAISLAVASAPVRRLPIGRKPRKLRIAAVAVIGGLLATTSAAAATNHLPAPVQEIVANIGDSVGVVLPRPEASSSPPATAVMPPSSEPATGSPVGSSSPGDGPNGTAGATASDAPAGSPPSASTASATGAPPSDTPATSTAAPVPPASGIAGVPANGQDKVKSDNGLGNGGVPGAGKGRTK
jgi:hypothetical protein